MARDIRSWLVVFAVLIGTPHFAFAQGVEYVRTYYTKSEHLVPMRDGVRLFTAIYTPKDTTRKVPILMIRTQSGVEPYGSDRVHANLGPSSLFAKEGYIFVVQDVRGRWMSEGTWVRTRPIHPSRGPKDIDESTDAYDTIDWVLKNVPGHNGNVGLYGTSYRGWLSACGAISGHPAIKAVTIQAPVIDTFVGDDWRRNGATILAHAFYYAHRVGTVRPKPVSEPFYKAPDFGTPDGYDFFLRHGSLADLDARFFKGQNELWNDLIQHPTYDATWKSRDLRPFIKGIKPAILTVGGWFDAENLFGALETHQCLEADKARNTFVMGPWIHGGWNGGTGASLGHVQFGSNTAEFFREKIELPFFNYHLKGQGDWKPAKVLAFETGANRWHSLAAWPTLGAGKQSLFFAANSRLAFDAPHGQEQFDEFISDPARPVPYTEKLATRMPDEFMCADQRFASRRPDVLVYETDPLDSDLTLAGPIDANLFVSTTGTDSDWIVKLVDVYPNDFPNPQPNPTGVQMGGYQQLVRAEVIRGRFRNSLEKPEPMTPREPTKIAVRLLDVFHTFQKGHRIQVQVHSTWFPLVERNPQTYVDIGRARASDYQKATQRIYRSNDRPSRLIVSTLPK